MSQKNHTYVDVTQLAHWAGRLTGIPRVMHELAIRFAQKPNTHFVVWVKEVQEMCEIDLHRTLSQRGNGIVYLRHNESTAVDTLQSERQDNRAFAKILKRRTVRLAKAAIRHTSRLNPALATLVEKRARVLYLSGLKHASFKRNDILLIPWGEWWDEGFAACLLKHQKAGLRLVQVIHDIATTVQPQFFEEVAVSPSMYNAKIVPVCSLVLAVSENTKRELAEWLKQNHLHVPPIKVFRNGDNIAIANAQRPHEESFTKAELQGHDFLLCVGTIEAKKNHALFYYVYKLASIRGIILPKLIIVGRRGWRTDDIYEIMTRDTEMADKFLFLHDVSDEELAWLYDNCLFTVLPSFHEGWGIPVAESLARGVPCLCSNTSSMVEIAEGIVGHFTPFSTDECLSAIQQWLHPKELEKARIRSKTYKPTSWDETYKQVNAYIEELA